MSDLIDEIRRENGFDHALDSPETISTVKALQGNMNRGLQILSDELYSKSTHFLLEFVQNAEDNSYAKGVTPTLRLKLENRRIRVECNEVGFTEANVRAICKIGISTKTGQGGYIGEKGIGFKSVFKVADVVHISSGVYTFKLDRREELGMITPIWAPSLPVVPGCTTFDLELSGSADPKMLLAHLKDIQPALLLFLRKLRYVTIEGPIGPQGRTATIEIHRDDVDTDIVSLQRIENGRSSITRYFRVTLVTQTHLGEERRRDVTHSNVVLAFPLTETEAPQISVQSVHAFLPLRSYGFTFIIQADFLTSASREDILSDLLWNVTLRDAISTAFLDAVTKFSMRPSLKFTWFRYLPRNIHDSFLGPVENEIISKLSLRPILCSADGTYRPPNKFIIAGSFCDADDKPLIPEAYLPGKLYYLSHPYDLDTDGTHFERLGVKSMSNEHFVGGLNKMRSQMPLQSTIWHEAVCQKLYEIPHTRTGRRDLSLEIRQLPILPLSDGSWASGSSDSDIFFDTELAGIPQDLGIQFLEADISPASWRHKLFKKLGVREADCKFVASKILEHHRNNWPPDSVQSMISHAVFMFVHRYSKGCPHPTGLRVMDERAAAAEAKDIYANIPDPRQSIRMRDVLPPPARFLHPDYLQEDGVARHETWKQWLHDSLGLNIFPRLIDGGKLSPEFEVLARTVDTRKLLIVLKETWPEWSGRLNTSAILWLSQIVVVCEDGSKRMLKESYIQKESLKHCADLPFLPIDEPDDADWNFLSKLGVTSRVDGSFYLRQLMRLKDENSHDVEMIEDTYQKIEALFHDDPQNIRNSFSQQSLIYHQEGKQWIAASSTVWSGPLSMTSNIPLKVSYPFLGKLFHSHLGIPIAGLEILAKELQSVSEKWKGKVLPKTIRDQISARFCAIADEIASKSPSFSPHWLRLLSSRAIFPVESPTSGFTLCASGDHFYIPDKNGALRAIFSPDVPFLSLSESIPIHRVQPLLESDTFRSRVKFLEESVRHTALVHEPRLLNTIASEHYATRSQYIERYMRSTSPSKLTPEVQELLAGLKNVAVYDVGSIELTYTLDDSTHTIAEDAILKTDAMGLVIQQIKTSGNCELVICTKLAKLLLMDVYLVWICVSQTADMVQTIFKMQGIPELEVVDDSTDHSWLQSINGRDHFESHVSTTPLSSSQAGSGARTVGAATNNQRSTLDPLYAQLNGWRDHNQWPTPMTHDPQDDLSPQDKTKRTVGVATSSRGLTSTTRSQHDLSPQDNTDRMHGAGASSRSPTLMADDFQHDPSLQDKTNRMPIVVINSQRRLPITRDLQHDSGPPDKTDRTSDVTTSGLNPTPTTHDLQQDTCPHDKTNRTAGVITNGRDPTPLTRDLQHDPIPQDKTDRTYGVVTNNQTPTPNTLDPQYNPSPQDETDRTPNEVTSSRDPTQMARDSRDDLSPQDKTDQTVETSGQSPTQQARDLQYHLSLQETMDHLDPVATTTHPGEAMAQAEVLIPQPPCLFPYVMPPYNVDSARTSSVYLSPSLGPNISLPANRPDTLNDAQFLGGGYHTGDLPDTGQHIRDGIAGEHFIYIVLSLKLPGFGPDNWTSELRKEVEGFTPYLFESIADFVYPDYEGVFTAMLYGESQREIWKDQWPTYYLEVKSTSHGHREPFHMSRKQIDTASRLTNLRSSPPGPPKAIYAIIRVSNVSTHNISWKIYADPHRQLYEGVLLNVSNDVYLVATD